MPSRRGVAAGGASDVRPLTGGRSLQSDRWGCGSRCVSCRRSPNASAQSAMCWFSWCYSEGKVPVKRPVHPVGARSNPLGPSCPRQAENGIETATVGPFEGDRRAIGGRQLAHDREPEAAGTGGCGAALPEAVERPLALLFTHTRAVITHMHRNRVVALGGADINDVYWRAGVDRVGEKVVEDLLEVAGHHGGPNGLGGGDGDGERDVLLVGQGRPRGAAFDDDIGDVHSGRSRRLLLSSTEGKQAVDQPGQPVDLTLCVLEMTGLITRQLDRQVLQAETECRERRAELMGGVGDELLLRRNELSQTARRPVELRRQGGDLCGAFDGSAGRKIAVAEAARSRFEREQWPGESSCQP